jgi:hypothetical protein
MLRKRITLTPLSLALLVFLIGVVAIGAAEFRNYLPFIATSKVVEAQDRETSSMQQRLDQVIGILQETRTCGAAAAAIDDGMEILYGGLRPLPSPNVQNAEAADQEIARNEMRFAAALNQFAHQGEGCDEEQRRAVDLKLFIEEMNEVARAVGEITRQCGEGASLDAPPCNELQPLLEEEPDSEPRPSVQTQAQRLIRPSFSVKLRSPFVPQWFGRWEEDVRVTDPIGAGECVVVFKETRGLMLRLHFERVIIVRDPWVATFGVPRGTRIPIWALEWVPSEYVKEWNICHRADGKIEKTVTQRVKQDIPLNFFWRFYPKDP